jgi:hypothetical protein
MKLGPRPSTTSFYESFSDLIFGTLVLFIVLVMGLVVKLQETVNEQEDKPTPAREVLEREIAAEMVAKNRFTGGSDNTYMYWCAVRHGGDTWLAFFPIELVNRWQLVRSEESNPVRTVCELLLKDDGLFMIPASDAGGLGAAFGEIETETWVVYHWELGYTLDRAIQQRRRLGAGVTVDALTDAVGGLWPSAAGFEEWSRWIGRTDGDGGRMARLYAAFEAASKASGIAHTRLQFHTDPSKRTVGLGGLDVSGGAFASLLRSIKPGRGFFVEHLGPGGAEDPPPDWVKAEVLKPTGFDGRALSSEAERLLGED